jgi:hypothetical protein
VSRTGDGCLGFVAGLGVRIKPKAGWIENMRAVVCPICNNHDSATLYGAKLPPDFAERAPPLPYSAHYQINRCADRDVPMPVGKIAIVARRPAS